MDTETSVAHKCWRSRLQREIRVEISANVSSQAPHVFIFLRSREASAAYVAMLARQVSNLAEFRVRAVADSCLCLVRWVKAASDRIAVKTERHWQPVDVVD